MSSTFEHAPSQIVQQVLIQLGFGKAPSDPTISAADWAVGFETEPDLPDRYVTVQEIPGRQDMRDMLTGEQSRTYGFQIRVRGSNRAEARFKADQISTTIARRDQVYFDLPACWVSLEPALTGTGAADYVLQCFVRIGNPVPIGADRPGGKRQVFTINCEARIVQQ